MTFVGREDFKVSDFGLPGNEFGYNRKGESVRITGLVASKDTRYE